MNSPSQPSPDHDQPPKPAPLQEPAPQTAARWMGQIALVTELPFVLVGATLAGAVAGYFLDGWLHTRPWLLLIFGAVGFAGGMRELMRRLNSLTPKSPPPGDAPPARRVESHDDNGSTPDQYGSDESGRS